MNGRERVLCALDGGEPDRVPCALGFFRVDPAKVLPAGSRGEELIDVQFVRFPLSGAEERFRALVYPHGPDTRLGNSYQLATYSEWRYRPDTRGLRNPLESVRGVQDIRDFPFPEPEGEAAAELRRGVEEIHSRGQAAGGSLPHLGGELFETAWRLRGLESFLLDLVERQEWAHCLLDRLCERAAANARTVASAGVDVLSLDDDVGMPLTMMMDPSLWREFFKPRLARIIASARSVSPGLRILYHSDGYFEPILPDLLEAGVAAINPLQPEHMDAAQIRRRYGGRLALWGMVGSQCMLSGAAPDAVRAHVAQILGCVGRRGVILCPAYDVDEPDTRKENVAAFLEGARS